MNKKAGVFIEIVMLLIIVFLLYKLGWLQIAWQRLISIKLGG